MSLESLTLNPATLPSSASHLPVVAAELNYLVPMAEKPFSYTYEPPDGTPPYNATHEAKRVVIRNGRSQVADLSLDREGFALITQGSAVRNFYDPDEIRQAYYPEAERLVKAATGAAQVLVFDHNLRNAQQAAGGVAGVREPVKRVHNDFTAKSGYRRSRDELAAIGVADPDALLQGRFSIINLWRPIAQPVQESPLAVCDARSIAPEDWVASDLIYRDRVGETYWTTYNPAHRWFYFPQLQPDEALLIKCFDSDPANPARFTAHTAFDDPTSPPNAPPRSSIELRTLVIY
ncbi:MAG: CmcJ/NvfI family oxidoreductase [Cyanobacteria bacterium J069]|nr:MAG: methyltransferase [Cyanobacteria bacterium J069]